MTAVKVILGVVLLALLATTSVTTAGPLPECDKKSVLKKLNEWYSLHLSMKKSSQSFSVDDPHEVATVPPPASVNQYTPTPDYYDRSRYCEATVVRADGEKDAAYYRLDGEKNPNAKGYNLEFCSMKSDVTKRGCVTARTANK